MTDPLAMFSPSTFPGIAPILTFVVQPINQAQMIALQSLLYALTVQMINSLTNAGLSSTLFNTQLISVNTNILALGQQVYGTSPNTAINTGQLSTLATDAITILQSMWAQIFATVTNVQQLSNFRTVIADYLVSIATLSSLQMKNQNKAYFQVQWNNNIPAVTAAPALYSAISRSISN
jgi:hypothetical protein